MTRRMPRAVQHIQLDLAEADLVAPVEPARRLEAVHIGKTEHLALLRHTLDPETVFLVRAFDRHARPLHQRRHATGVIDMTMGDQHFDQGQLFVLQRAQMRSMSPPGSITTA